MKQCVLRIVQPNLGTSRDQKHILGRQVNLPSGKQLSLGYEAVCVEDSSPLLDNVIAMS